MVLKHFQSTQLVSDRQFHPSTRKLRGNSSHSTGNITCNTKDWVSSILFNCVGKIQSCSGKHSGFLEGRKEEEVFWRLQCRSLVSFRHDSSIVILGWRISNFCTPPFSYLLPAFPTHPVRSSPSSPLSHLTYLLSRVCQAARKGTELHTIPTGGRKYFKSKGEQL